MNISSLLKQFRRRHRIQVQELAKESGLDSPTISRLENGWRPITQVHVERLRRGYLRLAVLDETFFETLGSAVSGSRGIS